MADPKHHADTTKDLTSEEQQAARAISRPQGRRSGAEAFSTRRGFEGGPVELFMGKRVAPGAIPEKGRTQRVAIRTPETRQSMANSFKTASSKENANLILNLSKSGATPADVRRALLDRVQKGQTVPRQVRATFTNGKGVDEVMTLRQKDIERVHRFADRKPKLIREYDEKAHAVKAAEAKRLNEANLASLRQARAANSKSGKASPLTERPSAPMAQASPRRASPQATQSPAQRPTAPMAKAPQNQPAPRAASPRATPLNFPRAPMTRPGRQQAPKPSPSKASPVRGPEKIPGERSPETKPLTPKQTPNRGPEQGRGR